MPTNPPVDIGSFLPAAPAPIDLTPFEPKPVEPDVPSGFGRRLADLPVGFTKGVVDLPSAAVGLADIATGGAVGRGVKATLDVLGKQADTMGLPAWARPSQWSDELYNLYSPEVKAAFIGVGEDAAKAKAESVASGEGALGNIASTALGAFKGMAAHPASIPAMMAENLSPMMLIAKGASLAIKPLAAALDAKVASGVMTAAEANEKLGHAAIRASSVGEGLQAAGQVSSQISADQPDAGFLEHLAAAAAGITTAGITRGVGKIPGFGDVEASLATQMLGRKTGFAGSLLSRTVKGAVGEGILQEPLQSAQEQIWQNIAEGKPWHEDVGEQLAQGAVVGMGLGAGGVLFSGCCSY